MYEFLLVLMGGSVLWGAGHPGLGSWLVVSAVGLLVSNAYIVSRNNAIDRARNDAMATQRITMQRWQTKAQPAGKSKVRLVMLLALLAGAGWWIYGGGIVLPRLQSGHSPELIKEWEEVKSYWPGYYTIEMYAEEKKKGGF